MKKFFGGVQEEFSKVVWPSRNEIVNATFLVVALSISIGVYLGAFDFLFSKLLDLIIK